MGAGGDLRCPWKCQSYPRRVSGDSPMTLPGSNDRFGLYNWGSRDVSKNSWRGSAAWPALPGVSAFCIVPSVFASWWLCAALAPQRGFGQVAHAFLALNLQLSALGFSNPLIFCCRWSCERQRAWGALGSANSNSRLLLALEGGQVPVGYRTQECRDQGVPFGVGA